MPGHVEFAEFRDEQRGSLYPFADSATLVGRDRAPALDRDMLLDASAYPIGGGVGMGITRIDVSEDRSIVIWVGTTAAPTLASASFSALSPPATLGLADAYGRPAGLLLCEPTLLAASRAWPTGTHVYPAGACEFVASCCVPVPATCLRGVLLEDGGPPLVGEVWLVGDGGIVLTEEHGTVRVDVVGDPLGRRRRCEPAGLFSVPTYIKAIRVLSPGVDAVVGPGPFGSWEFVAGDGLADDTALRIDALPPATVRISVAGRPIGG